MIPKILKYFIYWSVFVFIFKCEISFRLWKHLYLIITLHNSEYICQMHCASVHLLDKLQICLHFLWCRNSSKYTHTHVYIMYYVQRTFSSAAISKPKSKLDCPHLDHVQQYQPERILLLSSQVLLHNCNSQSKNKCNNKNKYK